MEQQRGLAFFGGHYRFFLRLSVLVRMDIWQRVLAAKAQGGQKNDLLVRHRYASLLYLFSP
jgi:hypothetical protein